MRFATFEVADRTGPERRLGLAIGDEVLDVTAGYARLLSDRGETAPVSIATAVTPPDLVGFLGNGDRALDAAAETLDRVRELRGSLAPDGARILYQLEEIDLRSPVPRPNLIRQFSLFEEHATNTESYAEGEGLPAVWYDLPIYWKGNPRSIVHPDETMVRPAYTDELDCELEIAAVVGREGRDVPAAAAAEYIAGLTIHNDWSARDMQRRERGRGVGPSKSKDFAYTFGPYLVQRTDLDAQDLAYRVRVNGETIVERSLSLDDLQHSFEEVVEFVSSSETIYPGDVLTTGGVPDCGPGEVGAEYLDPGDEVALTVEGIGTLRNTVG